MGTTINLEPTLIPEFRSPPSAAIESGTEGSTSESSANQVFCKSVVQFTRRGGWRVYLVWKARENVRSRTKMSDQERWLNEILDILGLPRDTAYRDYTRELAERGASLEQIYGTLRSRMNARLS